MKEKRKRISRSVGYLHRRMREREREEEILKEKRGEVIVVGSHRCSPYSCIWVCDSFSLAAHLLT